MAVRQPLDVERELLDAFDHAARVSDYLVSTLPPAVWRAAPPGGGRSIAAIVAHMQGVRRTFARMGGATVTPPVDRARTTPAQARRALAQSRKALLALFRASLARGETRVKGMPRRTVDMMVYLAEHDAHHRGQICSIARGLGHRLPTNVAMRIWGWKKLPGV
jgi:uncharacterized damage-inducible protein DinB